MSIVQTPDSPRMHLRGVPVRSYKWRFLYICLLFLLSFGLNVLIEMTAPPADTPLTFLPLSPFMLCWLLAFLPYAGASILILATRPPHGRRHLIELGFIIIGACILRAMLLLLPPDLSHDSWRYLWDARVTLHGYSPYVYAPTNPQLVPLQNILFANSRFRNVPTAYPPGAQAIYLLSYLIAPDNLFFLKGIFVVFDLVTCGALAFFLARRGLDPSRVIIYAWCPLPIVEFAIQGHLDASTIMFSVLALVCALSSRPGMRILTGFLIALATLTKIYPIILLLIVLRRRDWALLVTCCVTIVLAYVPYLILGHGQVLGFFASYASEYSPNGGLVEQIVSWASAILKMNAKLALILKYCLDLLLVGSASLLVLWLRYRRRISMEAGALILIGVVFGASSHIFPWYTPALLPWVVMLAGTPWTRAKGLSGKGLAVAVAWYFTCITIISYFFSGARDWRLYYPFAYDVTLLGLALAAFAGWRWFCHFQKSLN